MRDRRANATVAVSKFVVSKKKEAVRKGMPHARARTHARTASPELRVWAVAERGIFFTVTFP